MPQCLPSERADWLAAGSLIALFVVPVVSDTVRLFSPHGAVGLVGCSMARRPARGGADGVAALEVRRDPAARLRPAPRLDDPRLGTGNGGRHAGARPSPLVPADRADRRARQNGADDRRWGINLVAAEWIIRLPTVYRALSTGRCGAGTDFTK